MNLKGKNKNMTNDTVNMHNAHVCYGIILRIHSFGHINSKFKPMIKYLFTCIAFFLEFTWNPNSSIIHLPASFIVKSISELSKMFQNCVNQRRINIMWLVNSQFILGTNSSMASLYWSLNKKQTNHKRIADFLDE